MMLTVSSEVIAGLIAAARTADPIEACGLLFGAPGAIAAYRPAANVHPQPARRFEIDPRALIDAHRAMRGGGPRVAGYYHSHPAGPPEPSATDHALAAADGAVWAIVGARTQGWRVSLWRAGDDGLTSLPYRVTDG